MKSPFSRFFGGGVKEEQSEQIEVNVDPQMATEDLAGYLCITKEALPVRKNRIAKKLGITSVELGVFLQKLADNE